LGALAPHTYLTWRQIAVVGGFEHGRAVQ
jgi:hypothetical protein